MPKAALTSASGMMVPRRLVTPTSEAGIPGIGVIDSGSKTSMTWRKSMAKLFPPNVTRQTLNDSVDGVWTETESE